MRLFLIITAYVLHFALTYLVQRQILRISKHPEYHPKSFMLFVLFVPCVGLVSSLVVLAMELLANVDYKKFYRIKSN